MKRRKTGSKLMIVRKRMSQGGDEGGVGGSPKAIIIRGKRRKLQCHHEKGEEEKVTMP